LETTKKSAAEEDASEDDDEKNDESKGDEGKSSSGDEGKGSTDLSALSVEDSYDYNARIFASRPVVIAPRDTKRMMQSIFEGGPIAASINIYTSFFDYGGKRKCIPIAASMNIYTSFFDYGGKRKCLHVVF
jgi:hypothetical protein